MAAKAGHFYRVVEYDALGRRTQLASKYATKREAQTAAKRLKEAYPLLRYQVASMLIPNPPRGWIPTRAVRILRKAGRPVAVQIKTPARSGGGRGKTRRRR